MKVWLMFVLLMNWWRQMHCNLQPVVVGSSSIGNSGSYSGSPRCEEITIPMCKGIGYNLTSMPNELNQDSQEEAGFEVHQFWPLVEINCSTELKFFLCSMYVPICFEDYHTTLKVCRSVCERARAGCEPIMEEYGFQWPERMNCSKLPSRNETNMCMEPPPETKEKSSAKRPTVLLPKCKPGQKGKNCRELPMVEPSLPTHNRDCTCRCKQPLVSIERDSPWFNRSVTVGEVDNCAFPCRGVFFSKEEKEFATVWIALWSGLCCVATLMTLTTFLIDTERFKYPERPIVFLSGCYFLVSVGYLIRVFLGHDEVACEDRMIVYSANGPKPCTLVFLLVYFFGMASSIWWVILTFTWFLAAGFKWSNEAIASYSQYFHLAAWLIPTVKSVGVLIMSAVDGDPVAGICSVGNQNPNNLKKFVLFPLIVYLLIGMSFLFGGFVSLFRIRSVFKNQGGMGRNKADKLEKLMIRIGIFSVLYTLPATVLIACYFYESTMYNEWMSSLTCPCSENYQQYRGKLRPNHTVLMLKYFMALAVGITSGVWIWSGKTLGSWRKLWRRLFGGGGSSNGKNHKPTLIGNTSKPRVVKQQYLLPPSIPVPPVPAPSSSLLSGPHITPTGNLSMGHHMPNTAASLHHHMIKQAQQAPLSHV